MVFMWDVTVSESHGNDGAPRLEGARHPSMVALIVLLALEALALVTATGYLVVELFIAPAQSVVSGLALAVVAAAGAAWLVAIVAGVVQGRAWTRGASLVVQVLILAVAVGSAQGADAMPILAIALAVPAVAVGILLFTPRVLAATSTR
jgi:hypothetical protein